MAQKYQISNDVRGFVFCLHRFAECIYIQIANKTGFPPKRKLVSEKAGNCFLRFCLSFKT
jgi:hypothetical protein